LAFEAESGLRDRPCGQGLSKGFVAMMERQSLYRAILSVSSFLVCGLIAINLLAAADDDVRGVIASWEKRRHVCKSVEYSLSGHVTIPAGLYTELVRTGTPFPEKMMSFPRQLRITLDLEKGRARRREKGMIIQLNENADLSVKDEEHAPDVPGAQRIEKTGKTAKAAAK
jgi:hypothetical protein